MAPLESPVVEAERRAWRYWFVDGLPNLVAGLACLLLAFTFILLVQYQHTRSPLLISVVILALIIGTAVFYRMRQTLEWLKARVTYPRSGFAAAPYFTDDPKPPADLAMLNLSSATEKETTQEILRSEDVHHRLWYLLGIGAAASLVGIFVPSRLLCAIAGLVAGALIWFAARKDARKSWDAVYSLLLVQVIFTINAAINTAMDTRMNTTHIGEGIQLERIGYFGAGVGSALALAGTITLVRYLRHNPARQA